MAGKSRAQCLALAGIVAAVNLHATYIIGSVQSLGLMAAATNLFGLSGIVLFAFFGLWAIGHEASAEAEAATLSQADRLILALALLMCAVPWHIVSFGALTLLGFWCMLTGAEGSPERRASLIMLAVVGSVAIGRLLVHSVGDEVVTFDAHFVGWLAGVPVNGNVVDFSGAGERSFIVGLPCSSVHNMSQAVLLWATVTQLLRLKIDAKLVGFALLAMIGLFLVNAARLVTIAWFPAHFDTIHNGVVGELFGLASLIAAGLIVAMGALHAHRRQN